MAWLAARFENRLRRTLRSAAYLSVSTPARKLFVATVAAALFVLLASGWIVNLPAVGGSAGGGGRRVIRPLWSHRPAPGPRRRSDEMTALNFSAPVTFLSKSSAGVHGATAVPPDVSSPPPPPRRRVVLFWTAFWGSSFKDAMKQSFPPSRSCNQVCELAYDRKRASEADALLFHAADLGSLLPNVRLRTQLWVLFNLEPPTNGYVSPRHDRLFNLTMTYRSDSDIEVGYGHAEALDSADNRSSPATWPPSLAAAAAAADFAKRKPYAYWLVSNCKDARVAYVRELSKHIRVDVYGKCAPSGSRSCNGSHDATTESDCEAELSATYAFYLAFENSLCPDYVTEKLWRTLASPGGAIPVVIGAPPSRYAQVAPPDSFVHAASFASPRDLAAHLTRVASNRHLFASYHRWRSSYRAHVGWYYELARGLCRLCELMLSEESRTRPARADLFRWFNSGCTTGWPSSG